MLINALCDYYDMLSEEGKVLPEGYSKVKIHYLVCLTPDGKIDEIIDYRDVAEIPGAGGKIKTKKVPKELNMPQRTEKPGIDANIIEHRPLYLFGLNLDEGILTPEDRTNKAKKSHDVLIQKNMDFLEDLNSPVVNAFRSFLQNWRPEDETENEGLVGLGKDYSSSGYAFCLSGEPDKLLHDDPLVKRKWEGMLNNGQDGTENQYVAQCATTGKTEPIARIHGKIKGVPGGLATGMVLIGYNNPSEESYGLKQSYNSNISETAMKKYTEAFNYLLSDGKHKKLLDDTTVVFWAMNPSENYEEFLNDMLFGGGDSEGESAEQVELMLSNILKDAGQGKIYYKRLECEIDPNVTFYMLGIKPNSSRLAIKYLYRERFGDMLYHIADFQKDLQVGDAPKPVPLYCIKRELVSPTSSKETVNTALMGQLMHAMLYGGRLPVSLLDTMIRRVKTDSDTETNPFVKLNTVRAGVIKACINRDFTSNEEEELKVALDKENDNQAYVCGRLFAVLEKLQRDASGGVLNRTIKDAYFASASSNPASVFPKLTRLAQTHMGKVKSPVYYSKLIGEITDKLQGSFPTTLTMADQGRFMIGYYQQYQSFFNTNGNNVVSEETEEE